MNIKKELTLDIKDPSKSNQTPQSINRMHRTISNHENNNTVILPLSNFIPVNYEYTNGAIVKANDLRNADISSSHKNTNGKYITYPCNSKINIRAANMKIISLYFPITVEYAIA